MSCQLVKTHRNFGGLTLLQNTGTYLLINPINTVVSTSLLTPGVEKQVLDFIPRSRFAVFLGEGGRKNSNFLKNCN